MLTNTELFIGQLLIGQLFIGPGEVAERLFWRFVPEGFRLKLASLKAKENTSVPSSKATVYCYSQHLADSFSQYQTELLVDTQKQAPKCSLIATVRNEVSGVESFFEALIKQSVLPDEVVICDGGSTDGTNSKLKDFAQYWENKSNSKLPFELKIIEAPGAIIAEGRNRAIDAARNEIVAITDFGCELETHWLERVLAPFSVNSKIDLSMGWYEPQCESEISKAFTQFLIPPLERIDPGTFLPSARSMALKKSLWQEAGGFPEYLSYAGEDSLFDYFCKFRAKEVAFVPEALVYWNMPNSYLALVKTIFRYSAGDAEGGKLFWRHYLWAARHALKLVFELLLAFCFFAFGGLVANIFGAVCFIAAVLRFVICTMRYQPFNRVSVDKDSDSKNSASEEVGSFQKKALKYLAASSMFLSQAFGFISGVLKRPKIELQKLQNSKPKGYLLVEVSSEEPALIEKTKSLVEEKLGQNYFVGVLQPLEWCLPIDHPKLELFKTSHFDEAVWTSKYGSDFERIRL